MLRLGSLSQSLGHDLAFSKEESTGTSPLRPDLLETVVAHVTDAEYPDVVVLVDGGSKLSD